MPEENNRQIEIRGKILELAAQREVSPQDATVKYLNDPANAGDLEYLQSLVPGKEASEGEPKEVDAKKQYPLPREPAKDTIFEYGKQHHPTIFNLLMEDDGQKSGAYLDAFDTLYDVLPKDEIGLKKELTDEDCSEFYRKLDEIAIKKLEETPEAESEASGIELTNKLDEFDEAVNLYNPNHPFTYLLSIMISDIGLGGVAKSRKPIAIYLNRAVLGPLRNEISNLVGDGLKLEGTQHVSTFVKKYEELLVNLNEHSDTNSQ